MNIKSLKEQLDKRSTETTKLYYLSEYLYQSKKIIVPAYYLSKLVSRSLYESYYKDLLRYNNSNKANLNYYLEEAKYYYKQKPAPEAV